LLLGNKGGTEWKLKELWTVVGWT